MLDNSDQRPSGFLLNIAYRLHAVCSAFILNLWTIVFKPVERLFLSEHFVRRRLNGLDAGHGKTEDQPRDMPELEVTDMNTSQLLLDIKESHGSSRSVSESAEEIEVIHEKHQPKLHGILKQRSRTTSESSDDILSSSYSRQYSTGGESSPTPLTEESEEDTSETSMKKSVSFSEEVDRTLYKVNQSVTSMRSTLKNKRKKVQKKEKKQAEREKKRESRRRRNSNSVSEPSSDEPATPDAIEDGKLEKDSVEERDAVGVSGLDYPSDKKVGNIKCEGDNVEVTESESVATVKGTSDGDDNPLCDSGCDSVSRVNGVHNLAAEAGEPERTCDSDDDGDLNSGGVQTNPPSSGEVADSPKPDSVLSWNDGPSAEPKAKCAFEFSNKVMFELDLD